MCPERYGKGLWRIEDIGGVLLFLCFWTLLIPFFFMIALWSHPYTVTLHRPPKVPFIQRRLKAECGGYGRWRQVHSCRWHKLGKSSSWERCWRVVILPVQGFKPALCPSCRNISQCVIGHMPWWGPHCFVRSPVFLSGQMDIYKGFPCITPNLVLLCSLNIFRGGSRKLYGYEVGIIREKNNIIIPFVKNSLKIHK